MNVIIMASECGRGRMARTARRRPPRTSCATTRQFAALLRERAGLGNDRIIVDPGSRPVASDTTGGVNLCLDAIHALRAAPDLTGIDISVGLSNFAIGAPKRCGFRWSGRFCGWRWTRGWTSHLPIRRRTPLRCRRTSRWWPRCGGFSPPEGPDRARSAEDAGFRQLDGLMEPVDGTVTATVDHAQMDLPERWRPPAGQPVRWLRVARMFDSRHHRMSGTPTWFTFQRNYICRDATAAAS